MQESMSSATQLVTDAKFTPKQEATTLANLCVPNATLAIWPCRTAKRDSYKTRGADAAGNDVNVPVQNLLVELGHLRLSSYIGT